MSAGVNKYSFYCYGLDIIVTCDMYLFYVCSFYLNKMFDVHNQRLVSLEKTEYLVIL